VVTGNDGKERLLYRRRPHRFFQVELCGKENISSVLASYLFVYGKEFPSIQEFAAMIFCALVSEGVDRREAFAALDDDFQPRQ
jgi:hypothetical protein